MESEPAGGEIGLNASAQALDSLTTAAQVHDDPPIDHIL